jgi:hypothetical protein
LILTLSAYSFGVRRASSHRGQESTCSINRLDRLTRTIVGTHALGLISLIKERAEDNRGMRREDHPHGHLEFRDDVRGDQEASPMPLAPAMLSARR